ncbi:PRC-barrel domain containing protein [Streptomyces sp. NPDC001941]|uniref:PRC-barrel domain containing protein n=1 Tax=Streptomyces sp. NPDC001941 TaxID=3154659 RepID=UPI003317BAA5
MDKNIWGYQKSVSHRTGSDLTGFKVEATDGGIGRVERHSEDADSAYIVVDMGSSMSGKEVLLPAGTVSRIDMQERKILVGRTKEEIKNSPPFDKEKHLSDPTYHEQLGSYYGRSQA